MSTEIAALRMGASKELALAIENAVIEFRLEEELEKAHFLGQMHVESQGFTRLRENLNYSVQGLLSTFQRHRISREDAEKYGRVDGVRPANQVMLGNILYGGEWGRKNLGNTEPNDGYNLRGGGLKHLTGRYNIGKCSRELFGDTRLLDNPDLLTEPVTAARSAAWFWVDKKLKPIALRDDVEAVTRVVNGGINGLEDRRVRTQQAKDIFNNMRVRR